MWLPPVYRIVWLLDYSFLCREFVDLYHYSYCLLPTAYSLLSISYSMNKERLL